MRGFNTLRKHVAFITIGATEQWHNFGKCTFERFGALFLDGQQSNFINHRVLPQRQLTG